jgi:hypothetical protein
MMLSISACALAASFRARLMAFCRLPAARFERRFNLDCEQIAGLWRQQFIPHQSKNIFLSPLTGEAVAVGASRFPAIEIAGAAIRGGAAHYEIAPALIAFEQARQ